MEFPVKICRVEGIRTPIAVREGTSDEPLVQSIFIRQEYAMDWMKPPAFIIDAGANVGYSAVFFANRWPQAQILAIEPESSNFEMLEYNTRDYSNIVRLQAGLSNRDGWLSVNDVGLEHWGFMTTAVASDHAGAVPAITISTILSEVGVKDIGLLKIDIEGAEKEVFTDHYEDWLPHVNVLTIELHDRMKRGCGQVFFSAISQYPLFFHLRGENLIFFKESACKEEALPQERILQ